MRNDAGVEIDDGGGGERVERGAQVGHGSGEDSGNEQAAYAVRHARDDEGWKDGVGAGEGFCWRREFVVDEEHCADEEEERELEEDGDSAGEKRGLRLALAARGKKTLDDELVGAVTGGSEECAADDAGPQRVGRGEVPGCVDDAEFVGVAGNGMDVHPSAGNEMQDGEEADDGAGDVDG